MGRDTNLASHIEDDEIIAVGLEGYDEERFIGSMTAVREMLDYLEEECSGNRLLREATTLACEGIFRTLYAIEHNCIKAGKNGE